MTLELVNVLDCGLLELIEHLYLCIERLDDVLVLLQFLVLVGDVFDGFFVLVLEPAGLSLTLHEYVLIHVDERQLTLLQRLILLLQSLVVLLFLDHCESL